MEWEVVVVLDLHISANIDCCHRGFPATEIMEPAVTANF